MNEFDIIKQYFQQTPRQPHVILGSGDDAALLDVPADQQLVISIDSMVVNQHFLEDMPATALAHKIVAISLSDMAAMGAMPITFVLALTLPSNDEAWLSDFSKGLLQVTKQYQVDLIGGDLTRGPLTLSATMQGLVPKGEALRRSGAAVGDAIYVTGYLGAAALAVDCLNACQEAPEVALQALYYPTPRVSVGLALRNVASACIDISDGLAQDLQHILTASGVGATLRSPWLPSLPIAKTNQFDKPLWQYALSGGDDYELCFTVPESKVDYVPIIAEDCGVKMTQVGVIEEGCELVCLNEESERLEISQPGFLHFSQ